MNIAGVRRTRDHQEERHEPASPVFGGAIDSGSQPKAAELGGGTYVVSGGAVHVTNATDPLNLEYVMGVGDSNTYWCEPGRADSYTWVPGTRCD